MVNPYSAGTRTLQGAPSFAWRTNDLGHEPRRVLCAVGSMPVLGSSARRDNDMNPISIRLKNSIILRICASARIIRKY